MHKAQRLTWFVEGGIVGHFDLNHGDASGVVEGVVEGVVAKATEGVARVARAVEGLFCVGLFGAVEGGWVFERVLFKGLVAGLVLGGVRQMSGRVLVE